MRFSTSKDLLRRQQLGAPHSLRTLLEHGARPAVGFISPLDVVKDPHLTNDEKRHVLASWASDASAVEDAPTWRWLLGTPEPVPLDDVRDALARLDNWSDDGGRLSAGSTARGHA